MLPQLSTLFYLAFILTVQKIQGFAPLDCECGVVNDDLSTRIVGGEDSDENEYPWMAAIYKNVEGHSLQCGGSLINNRYILTAGHCVIWEEVQDLSVTLGMHDKRMGGNEYFFSKKIIHPNFTGEELHDTNDIALLRTMRQVVFSRNVMPICLPHPESIYDGHTAVVAGWGKLQSDGPVPLVLQKTTLNIISLKSCLKNWKAGPHLSDTNICAYADDKDSCQGDSGGPLFYYRSPLKLELIGIISWGFLCATNGVPGMYTAVAPFVDWIANNTGDAGYCKIN